MSMLDPIGTIQTSPQELTTSQLKDSVMIFGRIRWINNGEERSEYRSDYGWNIWPLYYRVEDKTNGVLGVSETGYFAWQIPKGTYILYHLRWFDSVSGQRHFPLRLSFKAPETGNAYCIGTITFDVRSKRDFLGTILIKYWNHMIDDSCEQERQWFEKRYTKLSLPIQKSLLLYNSSIAEDIEGLENKIEMEKFMHSIYPLLMIYSY